MTYGSIIAIACALFVIFFIPYMERTIKEEITQASGFLVYKRLAHKSVKTAVR